MVRGSAAGDPRGASLIEDKGKLAELAMPDPELGR